MIWVTFVEMSCLSFLSNVQEKRSFVFGELLLTLFTSFFYEFKELTALVISLVPAWIMMQSGLSANKFSISFNVSTGKTFYGYLMISWEPFFTFSIKKEVTLYNNFPLFIWLNSMSFFPWYFRRNTVIEWIVFHFFSFLNLILSIRRDCESIHYW